MRQYHHTAQSRISRKQKQTKSKKGVTKTTKIKTKIVFKPIHFICKNVRNHNCVPYQLTVFTF